MKHLSKYTLASKFVSYFLNHYSGRKKSLNLIVINCAQYDHGQALTGWEKVSFDFRSSPNCLFCLLISLCYVSWKICFSNTKLLALTYFCLNTCSCQKYQFISVFISRIYCFLHPPNPQGCVFLQG